MIIEQRRAEIAFEQAADITEILVQGSAGRVPALAQLDDRGRVRRDAALEAGARRIAGTK